MTNNLFSYQLIDTPIHSLSGLSKLIGFLLLTFAVMFSYDIRVILGITLFSVIILGISKIKLSQVKWMMLYVGIFLLVNSLITFLFAPEEGVQIYGTRHVVAPLFGPYLLTQEQILYQGTKLLKYISIIPLGLIFLLTTNPSEFAASLNRIGVSYKVAYAVALTLRYFPDVQRDYHSIRLAQQARGLDLSHKAKLGQRFKKSLLIIVPLIFSTLDRIEAISNAMDLRGFGKHQTRTWYHSKKLKSNDHLAIGLALAIFIASLMVSVFINHGRFYNPFA